MLAVADPGFPRGRAPTLRGGGGGVGTPTYDFAKISQKLHEIERIRPLVSTLKSAFVDLELNPRVKRCIFSNFFKKKKNFQVPFTCPVLVPCEKFWIRQNSSSAPGSVVDQKLHQLIGKSPPLELSTPLGNPGSVTTSSSFPFTYQIDQVSFIL